MPSSPKNCSSQKFFCYFLEKHGFLEKNSLLKKYSAFSISFAINKKIIFVSVAQNASFC